MKKLFITAIAAATFAAGAAETFRLDADDTIIDRKSLPVLLKGRAVRQVSSDGKAAIQLRSNKFIPFQVANDGKIINAAGGKISFCFKPYFTKKLPGEAWTVYPIVSLYSSEQKSGFYITLTHHKGIYRYAFRTFDSNKKQCSQSIEFKFTPGQWYTSEVAWDDTGIEIKIGEHREFIRGTGPYRIGNNKFFSIGGIGSDMEIADFVISDNN